MTSFSLRAWVDALLAIPPAHREAAVLLVQQNERDATLLLLGERPVVLLLHDDQEVPGAEVIARIDAALAAERPEVLEGMTDRFVVVLVGSRTASATSLPARHPTLGAALVWMTLDPANPTVERLPGQATPEDVVETDSEEVRALLNAGALQVASGASQAIPEARRQQLEREGEEALAAQTVLLRRLDAGVVMRDLLVPAVLWLALIVAYYAFGGYSNPSLVLVRMGAASGPLRHEDGAVRLWTAGVLHFGVVHLFSNLIALLMWGALPVTILGPGRLLVLLMVGSVAGFVATTTLMPEQLGAGSSGGVMALLGAMLGMVARREPFIQRSTAATMMGLGVVYLGVQAVASLAPDVSFLGHLGGAVAGFVLAASGLLTSGISRHSLVQQQDRLRRIERGLMVLTLALWTTALALIWTRHHPWTVHWPPADRTQTIATKRWQIQVPSSIEKSQDSSEGEEIRWAFGQGDRDPLLLSLFMRPARDDEASDINDEDVQWTEKVPYTRGGAARGQRAQGTLVSNHEPCLQWNWIEAGTYVSLRAIVSPQASDGWKERAGRMADGVRPLGGR